ncbi:MAG: ABC transporter ATP-binding protein [Alphaproteobacteria bacterium]|nr:ABC transporter ATP-binding protein [Alphaproteobacteria bacterium]MDX5368342.1 ABC transporter ATP-binding protein [Alphaproteobacteria bacterium]MDX5463137.1 ABC transporter ATP-binding protein [Alphaproteobacteria bacterium]
MLRLDSVVKKFGGLTATNNVTLDFPEGSLHAVIGPNGAGKTTLFNLITGHLVPDSGQILLAGDNIAGQSPREIVHRGVGRAFQVASIFPTLTVEQSLMAAVASHQKLDDHLLSVFPPKSVRERADELIEVLGMQSVARMISANISHGDQKLLDIGLALALEPRVLLLDEPTAGMGPEERWQMMETVRRLWDMGDMTVVFIEHDMDIVFEVAQKIHVLCYGAVLAEGTADEIRGHPDVIEAYLGSEVSGEEATE